ncbi:MAG: replication endonuclease [Steroidobacteraceae bacterium]
MTPRLTGILLLFVRPRDIGTVSAVVRGMWLSEYSTESGANQHRAKLIEIDASQGSAAGYIAKYVSKNIDGHGAIGEANDDETGQPIIDGIARVDAWASIHGIRQFQQFGGPPVGLWREYRRLRDPVADRDIERVRQSADRGDWARIC